MLEPNDLDSITGILANAAWGALLWALLIAGIVGAAQ